MGSFSWTRSEHTTNRANISLRIFCQKILIGNRTLVGFQEYRLINSEEVTEKCEN